MRTVLTRDISFIRVERIATRAHDVRVVLLEEEDRLISAATERLVTRFPDIPESVVLDILGSARRSFDTASIRDFVPLFVERKTKEQLEALLAAGAPPLEATVGS